MRLLTKERENISTGDYIVFTNNETKEVIEVEVRKVTRFKDFKQLYKSFPKERLGYSTIEIANPDDMLLYYKEEDIERNGVIAIEIEYLKGEKNNETNI